MIIPIPNKNTNLTEGSSSIPVLKKSCFFLDIFVDLFSLALTSATFLASPTSTTTQQPNNHGTVGWQNLMDLFPTWNPDAGNRFTSTVSWILPDHSMIHFNKNGCLSISAALKSNICASMVQEPHFDVKKFRMMEKGWRRPTTQQPWKGDRVAPTSSPIHSTIVNLASLSP